MRFRRKAETVEAVQFDGTNEASCSLASGFNAEVIRQCWRVGEWAVSPPADPGHLSDADFRAQFEPVPAEAETASLRAQLAEERAARLRDESEHLGVRHELAEERAALSELSMALGNPCLEFDDEGLSVALVRHALTQLAEARAESERLRQDLAEARLAIAWFHGYEDTGGPRFPISEPGKRYNFRTASRTIPAVAKAIELHEAWLAARRAPAQAEER